MPGYDVQWNKNEKPDNTVASVAQTPPARAILSLQETIIAGDTIITKKGDTIFCKLIKESSTNLFYTENNTAKSIANSEVQYFNIPQQFLDKRKQDESKRVQEENKTKAEENTRKQEEDNRMWEENKRKWEVQEENKRKQEENIKTQKENKRKQEEEIKTDEPQTVSDTLTVTLIFIGAVGFLFIVLLFWGISHMCIDC
jgi:DNA polymerase III alpha subunit (gram-positive type)